MYQKTNEETYGLSFSFSFFYTKARKVFNSASIYHKWFLVTGTLTLRVCSTRFNGLLSTLTQLLMGCALQSNAMLMSVTSSASVSRLPV